MGGEWPLVMLADFSRKIGSGATPRGGNSVYLNEGAIYLIRSQNIYNDSFSSNGLVFISDDAAEKLKNVIVEENDILLNITGDSVARVCLARKEFLPARVNQHVLIIRPNPKEFDSRFIRYYLASPYQQKLLLNLASSGATRNALTKSMIENFEVPKPPLEIQSAIADQLEATDNKIELNRQTNKTLEKMAQALFKSWFVDFDPVIDNALEAGNTIPDELQDRAARRQRQRAKPDHQPLPDAIRQLFPSGFELTEAVGWVPMGWEIMSISDLAQVIKGKSYKSSELEESKTALVTLKSFMRGGGYRLDGLKEYTGKYKPEQEVFAGDLVIAYTDVTQAADVIGKPAMVISDTRYEHLVISLDVAVVRPEKNNYKYFLYGLAQTEKFQEHTHSHSTGTTVLHLGKSAVPEYSFAKPSDETLGVYINIVKPKYRSIDANIQNSRALEKLRDTLLPKLISGELRLPLDALSDSAQQLADATS